MGRRTCCCCIPLRAGLMILAPISLCIAILLAAAGIIYTSHSDRMVPELTTGGKAAMSFYIIFQIVVAVSSILAFVGATTKQAGLVKPYASVLTLNWIAGLAMGVAFIVLSFVRKPQIIERCQDRTNQQQISSPTTPPDSAVTRDLVPSMNDYCEPAFRMTMGLFIAIGLVYHIVTLYIVISVHRAVKALQEEAREPECQIPAVVHYTGRYKDGDEMQERKGSVASSDASSTVTMPVVIGSVQERAGHARTHTQPRAADLRAAPSDTNATAAAVAPTPTKQHRDTLPDPNLRDSFGSSGNNGHFLARYASRNSIETDGEIATAGPWSTKEVELTPAATKQHKFSWKHHH